MNAPHQLPPGAPLKERRPLDPVTRAVLPLRAQPGYYPGYSTLAQQAFWDAATRNKILARVHNVPSLRFFTPEEAKFMAVVIDHVLPQDDRLPERRIPVLPYIDERLYLQHTPGYRFDSMPPEGEAYRLGMKAIEQMAQRRYSRSFLDLHYGEQDELLKSIHDGKPVEGAEEIWAQMPVHRYWALLVQDCVESYYAHPWAWDEIGFGGPAYPRAYMRLENGEPEPWEVDEKRYAWLAPPACVSDPEKADIAAHSEHPVHGQGGTH